MPDYSRIVDQYKHRFGVRVRKWRTNMSGCAWSVRYSSGRTTNWIESPYPKTPISLAIFLHEIGHHAIGFKRYRLRCEEEYHVWLWAIEQMKKLGIEADRRVTTRFEKSMHYAVGKAIRRGVRKLPEPLIRYASAR